MNREIKFRAWSNEIKKFVDLFSITPNGKKFMLGAKGGNPRMDYCLRYEDWDDLILMQYTGLKDKKGNEIYEGDIVEWGIGEGEGDIAHMEVKCEFQYTKIYEVKYIGGGFNLPRDLKVLNCEIIGNIFENKELLTN